MEGFHLVFLKKNSCLCFFLQMSCKILFLSAITEIICILPKRLFTLRLRPSLFRKKDDLHNNIPVTDLKAADILDLEVNLDVDLEINIVIDSEIDSYTYTFACVNECPYIGFIEGGGGCDEMVEWSNALCNVQSNWCCHRIESAKFVFHILRYKP